MAGIEYKGNPDNGTRRRETICDVHRDVYQELLKANSIESINPEKLKYVLSRIETAFTMAKSMDAKLRQYKFNYDDQWWEVNKRNWSWDELKKPE